MPSSFSSVQVGSTQTIAVSTTESDLIVINDPKVLQKSILSFFYGVNMLGASELDIRYYAAFVTKPISGTGAYSSTDWYQLPNKSSTATFARVGDGYLSVVSTLSFVDSVATSNNTTIYPALAAIKATGKTTAGTTGTITLTAMVRDN